MLKIISASCFRRAHILFPFFVFFGPSCASTEPFSHTETGDTEQDGTANTEEEQGHLFWNCDAANVLSVGYVKLAEFSGSAALPKGMTVNITEEKTQYALTFQIKTIRYSKTTRPLRWESDSQKKYDMVPVHSFQFLLFPAVMTWKNETPPSQGTSSSDSVEEHANVTSVSLNVIQRPDNQYLGNTRLHFEKSKSFAPVSIRFNNECTFFGVSEYLLKNEALMENKIFHFENP